MRSPGKEVWLEISEDRALDVSTFRGLKDNRTQNEDKEGTVSEVRGKPGESGVLEPSETRK